MPGDNWQKFANLRLLLSYMYAHPGKKLLFMGTEMGQWTEWNAEKELDWPLLEVDTHKGLHSMVKDLNKLYKSEKSLHEVDFNWNGFRWINPSDYDNNVLSFIRYAENSENYIVCVFNLTPVVRENYTIGVPETGAYEVIFNSDSSFYGGSNVGMVTMVSNDGEWHNLPSNVSLTIPPLASVFLKRRK